MQEDTQPMETDTEQSACPRCKVLVAALSDALYVLSQVDEFANNIGLDISRMERRHNVIIREATDESTE